MRFLLTLLLLVSSKASANTIVISDVDDTIRQANVRELQKLTVLKQDEFSGLSILYRELEKVVTRFEYVSGVPEQLKSVSEFFIFWNHFPEGRLFARDTKFDNLTHKSKAIDQIVREVAPTQMLMFGDNGEKDPEIYKLASERHPGKAVIFIHQLYDVEIPAGQTAYLTSIDLSLELFDQGFVSAEGLNEILNYAAAKMMSKKKKDREEFYPSWAQCRLFYKNYSRPSTRLEPASEAIVQLYESYLRERCS